MSEVMGKILTKIRRGWDKFRQRLAKLIYPQSDSNRTTRRRPEVVSEISPAIPEPVQKLNVMPLPEAVTVADTPKTRADLFEIIQNAPLSIFSRAEREMLTTIFTLNQTRVAEIMLPETKIVYVGGQEVLGPLTLDKLYQSGLAHFPVVDAKHQIIGCIHTAHLNSLEIRDSVRARSLLDPGVFYVREDYTLRQALDVFLRNDCHFCLVVNSYGKIVGLLNFSDLCQLIFGEISDDNFLGDNDRLAVAKRQFPIEISPEGAD